jgi:hypothetical protein
MIMSSFAAAQGETAIPEDSDTLIECTRRVARKHFIELSCCSAYSKKENAPWPCQLSAGGLTMYVLIIVVAVLSSAIPVGVTSQNIGRFDSLEQCNAVANEAGATGAVVDLNVSRGVYWICVYAGPK